ncbi:MAG TPA: hypothetical protein DCZ95_18950 [Verrucomicrobia bacterium]|nr:MAG: hypothetical protein A2X46_17190 [Lentisphaerae bacterium GWF2_57_35]HBA86166.1 hypothetical protein [Verrucomicrobiota bacterium]
MDKNAIWKWLILVVLVSWSIVTITPLSEKIKYGLDLQGGTSYVLEVDTSELAPETVKDARERALEVIRNRVDAMGVAEPVIYPEAGNNRIVVQIPGLKAEDRERAKKNIQSAAFLEFRMVHPKNAELVAQLFEKGFVPEGYRIVSLDSQGPGMRGGKFWKKTEEAQKTTGISSNMDVRASIRNFHVPSASYELLLMKEEVGGQELFSPHYVNRRRELSGESLKTAGVDYQQLGQPIVNLKFDSQGSKRFAAVTSDYAPGGAKNRSPDGRQYLGIVLDGTLYSAPFIKTAIHGGEAIIEGQFSFKEAQDLAIVLRAGSLPAPVKVIEERHVDPSLGKDSVASGKRASIIGGVAVMLFMLGYYMLGGLIADLALVLNLVLLPLGLMLVSGLFSLLDNTGIGHAISLPTLTLPGIAGLALTIGMAVDANVLIFERMREEQRQGKRFASVISAGYDKAFSAIFDSNITTLLTAAIMFMMGSGAVRGFAVMLSAGIIVSMYSAIFVSRMVFELLARYTTMQEFKMFTWIRDTKIDFMGMRKYAAAFSIGLIVVTWVLMFARGEKNLGVDFTSGTSFKIEYAQKQPVEVLRQTLGQAGIKDAFIQYQREMGEEGSSEAVRENLEIKVSFADGDKAEQVIGESFKDFKILEQNSVDAQVGKEFTRKSIMAVLLSLVGLIIYISWRFEFAFSVGAVVALLHDALITIGIYCLLGRQISLPIVAAVLTVIGYSVNDTIVVFDRIREDLKLMRGKSFIDIANLSINQTLGRTVLTSLTTLLSVAALLIFGGGAINDFALALFIGIIIGTYSSIFVATPIVLLWHRNEKQEAK